MATTYPVFYGQIVYAQIDSNWIGGPASKSTSCSNPQNLLGVSQRPSPLVILSAESKVPLDGAGNPMPVSYGDQVVIASPGGAAWSSSGSCIYGAGTLPPTVFTLVGAPLASGVIKASLYSHAGTSLPDNLVTLSAGDAGSGLGTMNLTTNPTLSLSANSATSVELFLEAPYSPPHSQASTSQEILVLAAIGCALASGPSITIALITTASSLEGLRYWRW